MGDSHLNIAYNLEKFIIYPEEWTGADERAIPPDVFKMVNDEIKVGGPPIGIAYVPNWGYCVLASGQGPFVVWSQFDIEKYAKEENILNT